MAPGSSGVGAAAGAAADTAKSDLPGDTKVIIFIIIGVLAVVGILAWAISKRDKAKESESADAWSKAVQVDSSTAMIQQRDESRLPKQGISPMQISITELPRNSSERVRQDAMRRSIAELPGQGWHRHGRHSSNASDMSVNEPRPGDDSTALLRTSHDSPSNHDGSPPRFDNIIVPPLRSPYFRSGGTMSHTYR